MNSRWALVALLIGLGGIAWWILGTPFLRDSSVSGAPTTAGNGGGILPFVSGIRGKVVLGPACPAENPYQKDECLDRPYQTAVHVYRSGSSQLYALGESDPQGNFEFSMPPGSYTVTAQGGKVLPECIPVPVLVEPLLYASITISCDTGTR